MDLPSMRFLRRSGGDVAVKDVSFEKLADLASGVDDTLTVERVKNHLNVTDTPDFREGLFSNAVVLVEGRTDKMIIQNVACHMRGAPERPREGARAGRCLAALGISVVSCEGKRNIREQVTLLNELLISTYVVWDLDSREPKRPPLCSRCQAPTDEGNAAYEMQRKRAAEANRTINEKIYKYIGKAPPNELKHDISETHACFGEDIEDYLGREIGTATLKDYEAEIASSVEFGSFSSKNSYLVSRLIDKIYETGSLPMIEGIVEKVAALARSRAGDMA